MGGDLDSKNSDIVMDLLCKMNQENNMTIVFVTHDVNLKSYAHRVIHMMDGKIRKEEIIPRETREKALADLAENLKRETVAIEMQLRPEIRSVNHYSYV